MCYFSATIPKQRPDTYVPRLLLRLYRAVALDFGLCDGTNPTSQLGEQHSLRHCFGRTGSLGGRNLRPMDGLGRGGRGRMARFQRSRALRLSALQPDQRTGDWLGGNTC